MRRGRSRWPSSASTTWRRSGSYEGGFESFTDTLTSALRIAEAAHKRHGQLSGVPTGFRDLDGKLGGLHPSDLIILAGRPSMGKTALATNIAFNAARAYRSEADADSGRPRTADGGIVGFFSLEMSREQLATRILSEQTRIPSDRIRRGMVAADKFSDLVDGQPRAAAAAVLHRRHAGAVDQRAAHPRPPAEAAARPRPDRRRLSAADRAVAPDRGTRTACRRSPRSPAG